MTFMILSGNDYLLFYESNCKENPPVFLRPLLFLLERIIIQLVDFGRACAPVRCAHPSFWTHCHPKGGAASPPYPSIAAIRYEVPCPPPRPLQLSWSLRQYFWVQDSKLYTGATIRPTFSGFSFLYFLDLFFLLFSSFSSLLFNFFLFFSSYSSSASSFSFPFIF